MHTSFNPKSIAVLPFVNIGREENEYFSDGITEEIINALTKVRDLKVTARTSSFYYKHKNLDARLIGNELGVETLLEGSARIIHDRVRITAQLIRTDTGFHIWSENFDRDLSDIFELQDEISLLIADKIRENFGHLEVQEHLIEAPTKNIEAYKHLLQGRELRMRWNSQDVKDAIPYFEQSITLDPSYADAHFEKGWCLGMLASWGYLKKDEGLLEANRHIDIGLQLNPNSAMGHYVKGTISFWGYWNYKDAFEHLQLSLEINPNSSEVRDAMADGFSALGKIDEALANNEIALRINPLSANLYFTKGNMIYFKRNYKDSVVLFDKALSINPFFPLALEMKAAALLLDRNADVLSSFIENTPQLERPNTYRAIYDLMHNANVFNISKKEVEKEFQEASIVSLRAWDLYYQVYSGNHEIALDTLNVRIKERSGQLFNFRNDPFLEPLRTYRKYKEIEDSVFQALDLQGIVLETKSPVASSPLDNSQIEHYSEAIELLMNEKKLYIDPELSLKQLAAHVGLHANKLSWLLNNHFGNNFNDFINRFRIMEFQKMAIDPANKNLTLLGLAYDSGFNSKTVFNTFFKKETGMTPKQWVKQNTT
ncbi:helix-turn-helix domain-containing protein [Arenibacter troitsensis]|uniref:TolB amino-terminal domain-containing protein n=1 Tax=Arenibacter troitsensis TaxID=188872 RepID=A0A1X7HWS4_9FLAO|nr:helix-turn-helix domain-containing protein [Arenibacter troitsensis]SMG06430.1 TolB amino-terminal domain-containing protein [Arenibacter troitsensis]